MLKAAKTDAEKAAASAEIRRVAEDWNQKQERIKTLYKRQRDGETAVADLEIELERQVKTEEDARKSGAVAEEMRASGKIASFARLATGGGLESEAVRGIKENIRRFQDEITKNKAEFEALTRELKRPSGADPRHHLAGIQHDIRNLGLQAERGRAREAAQSRGPR